MLDYKTLFCLLPCMCTSRFTSFLNDFFERTFSISIEVACGNSPRKLEVISVTYGNAENWSNALWTAREKALGAKIKLI